jgi:hypothetical protein
MSGAVLFLEAGATYIFPIVKFYKNCEGTGVSMMTRRSRLLLLLLFLPPLTGCPDLSQVQEFAKLAESAKSPASEIVNDFKASCNRQNMYVHLPPPPAEMPPKPCISGDDLDKLGRNLLAEQNTLFTYIETLGKLASTEASGFEKIAPNLDTSFQDTNLSKAQQSMAKSVGTLVASMTNLMTFGYRKKKVLEILRDTDPAVTELSEGLANQVASKDDVSCKPHSSSGTSYFQLLCNEELLLKSYYEIPLAKDPDSPAGILLRFKYYATLDQLQSRKEAAIAYRKLMLSIGEAHTELLAGAQTGNFDKSSVKKIAHDLAQPISDMRDAIATLKKDLR